MNFLKRLLGVEQKDAIIQQQQETLCRVFENNRKIAEMGICKDKYKKQIELLKQKLETQEKLHTENAVIDDEIGDILAHINKLPAVKIIDDKGQGYYNRISSIISANNELTFIHEFGHSLDYGINKALGKGYSGYSKQLAKVVNNNRIRRLDKFPKVVSDKFIDIRKQYSITNNVFDYKAAKKDGWAAVSDIFDALTNGNMFDKARFAISGHGAKYYRKPGTKEPEIFAQYFYLRANNCTEALEFLKDNQPELLKSLEELFKMYIKDIKTL